MSISWTDLVRKQMDFVMNENDWHASLSGLLGSLSPDEAAWRPGDGGHTIYEIAIHLAYSAELVASRLQGEPGKWDESQSWPETPRSLTVEDWDRLKGRLVSARQQLADVVAALGDEKLAADRENKPKFIDTVLQIIHHEAFHTGQIALIRRQLGKEALM